VVDGSLSNYTNDAGFFNSITAVGENAGLDVTTSGNNIDVDLDLSEIAQSSSITGSDYLIGTTSIGTEARTLGRDFLQGSISAGSGISLSNTTEGVQISSTATGDITAVTVGTGLDGGATSGTANVSLDFGELETVSTVNGNDEFVMRTRFNSGGSLVATNAQVNVQDLLINTLTGGSDISVSTSGTSQIEIAYTGTGGTEFTSSSDESFAFAGNNYRILRWTVSGTSTYTIDIPDPDSAPEGAMIEIIVDNTSGVTFDCGASTEIYVFSNGSSLLETDNVTLGIGFYQLVLMPDPNSTGSVWAVHEN